jgi:hypothetical protein
MSESNELLPPGVTLEKANHLLIKALHNGKGLSLQVGDLAIAIGLPDDRECFEQLKALAIRNQLIVASVLRGESGMPNEAEDRSTDL